MSIASSNLKYILIGLTRFKTKFGQVLIESHEIDDVIRVLIMTLLKLGQYVWVGAHHCSLFPNTWKSKSGVIFSDSCAV